ncbi:MAG TPA: hypothetical protein VGF30_08625 [Bacteroidia bacterium]
MDRRPSIYFLVVCLLILNVSCVLGIPVKQDTLVPNALKVDKQTEEDIFSDRDYVYVQEDAAKHSDFFQELRDWLIRKIFGELSPENINNFWSMITYILAALFIAALIYLLLKMKGGRLFKGESARTSVFTDIREDIDTINIDDLIRKATGDHDYRLAFRYSFLKSLQLMNNKKLIDWKSYKTNYEYYKEFESQKMKPVFKDLYTGFEYVWYGEAPINREVYEKYNTEFNEFNRQLDV